MSVENRSPSPAMEKKRGMRIGKRFLDIVPPYFSSMVAMTGRWSENHSPHFRLALTVR